MWISWIDRVYRDWRASEFMLLNLLCRILVSLKFCMFIVGCLTSSTPYWTMCLVEFITCSHVWQYAILVPRFLLYMQGSKHKHAVYIRNNNTLWSVILWPTIELLLHLAGQICYGPFLSLPRESQELSLCCLYYFSHLDLPLLKSIACCCLSKLFSSPNLISYYFSLFSSCSSITILPAIICIIDVE